MSESTTRAAVAAYELCARAKALLHGLDTSNRFCVVRKGERILVAHLPLKYGTAVLDPHEAVNVAAWLVAISGLEEEFNLTLTEIKKT